tara:strand:- start:245 stop:430 length:186 start_codon:yes stop_codon:yes gene_type:complete
MSKLKINLEELEKDLDKVLSLVENLDINNLENLDLDKFSKKADVLKNQIIKKYKNNLDFKK